MCPFMVVHFSSPMYCGFKGVSSVLIPRRLPSVVGYSFGDNRSRINVVDVRLVEGKVVICVGACVAVQCFLQNEHYYEC